MSEIKKEEHAQVLDPVDRVSEIIFGLIMTLTFTGGLSAATAGRDEIRTMMFAALGCNLAWGLVDAVMYLVRLQVERARNLTLLRRLRNGAPPDEARAIIADELPGRLGEVMRTEDLESIRQRLAALPELPDRARLVRDDYAGDFGVVALVVLATFPVVIPFMLISTVAPAMRVSNAVALAILFMAGWKLGRYSGVAPWRSGVAIAGIGVALVAITMALGG